MSAGLTSLACRLRRWFTVLSELKTVQTTPDKALVLIRESIMQVSW